MPDILTPDSQSSYLSEDAYNADGLDELINEAETRVVDRFRGRYIDAPLTFDDAGVVPDTVLLYGWEEDDQGTPDIGAMPDELVHRLRMVIANVVEHWLDREDTKKYRREAAGSKRFFYRDLPSTPSEAFQPLEPYDQSEPIGGFW